VALVQHYFVTAWVPPAGIHREYYAADRDHLYSAGALLKLGTLAAGASTSLAATLYVGPQDQRTLEAIAPGLDLVADYGRLTFIAKPLFWLLGSLHRLVGNWGWAIVLLTVLIKAVFYPLSAASYKSMAKMKELQPKWSGCASSTARPAKAPVAMMELYKQEKINPLMAACRCWSRFPCSSRCTGCCWPRWRCATRPGFCGSGTWRHPIPGSCCRS